MAQNSWSSNLRSVNKEKNRKNATASPHGILASHVALEDKIAEPKKPLESDTNDYLQTPKQERNISAISMDSGFGDNKLDLQDCNPCIYTPILHTTDSTDPPQLHFIADGDDENPEEYNSNSQPEEHSVCEALPLGQFMQMTNKSTLPQLESICEESVTYYMKCGKDRPRSMSVPLPVSYLQWCMHVWNVLVCHFHDDT